MGIDLDAIDINNKGMSHFDALILALREKQLIKTTP